MVETSTGGNGEGPSPVDNEINASQSANTHVRLPAFWRKHPEVWFLQNESRFRAHNIKSERRKFDLAVEALPEDVAYEVSDLLRLPEPPADAYKQLQAAIISRFAESKQEQIRRLLTAEELGDRKPSQMLRRMTDLLGAQPNANDLRMLRELFLQRLPQSTRIALAPSQDDLTLEKLAAMADSIMSVTSPAAISEVHTSDSSSSSKLEQLVAQLTKKVDDLSSSFDKQQKHQARSRSVSRRRPSPHKSASTTRSATEESTLCWYHERFGKRASKCCKPCSWSGNGQGDC
jgi:hypothetical protein